MTCTSTMESAAPGWKVIVLTAKSNAGISRNQRPDFKIGISSQRLPANRRFIAGKGLRPLQLFHGNIRLLDHRGTCRGGRRDLSAP